MKSHQPTINAMIAISLAFGEAMGDHVLYEVGQILRELIADDVVDPETVDILESLLVGIDTNVEDIEELTWRRG